MEKTCTGCGETKSLEDFPKQKLGKYGRRATCRICTSAWNAEYRSKNKERVESYNAKYRREHRDRCLTYNRAWNKANPESINESQRRYREKIRLSRPPRPPRVSLEPPKRRRRSVSERLGARERVRLWRKANPQLHRAANSLRRARERGAAGTNYTTADHVAARIAFYGGRCFYCGAEEAESIDHRIPISKGGSHWPANLVPACKSCNSRKHAKTEREFRALRAA